jgi:hypothetical protein
MAETTKHSDEEQKLIELEEKDDVHELTNFKNMTLSSRKRISFNSKNDIQQHELNNTNNLNNQPKSGGIKIITFDENAHTETKQKAHKQMQKSIETKPKTTVRPSRPRAARPRIQLKKKTKKESDDENETKKKSDDEDIEDEEFSSKPRVERFLSICEIPPEILMYTQQIYGSQFQDQNHDEQHKEESSQDNKAQDSSNNNNIKDEKNAFLVNKRNSKLLSERIKLNNKKKMKKSTSSNDLKGEKIKHYHNGSGLSQKVRKEIIKSIIKSYDIEKYIRNFNSNYVIEVELNKKYLIEP